MYCLAAHVLGHHHGDTIRDYFFYNYFTRNECRHSTTSPSVLNHQRYMAWKNSIALKVVIQPHGLFTDENYITSWDEAQASILNMEVSGQNATVFTWQHISGQGNLWNLMTRVKSKLGWPVQETVLKSQTKEYQLKATTSLFSRLFAIRKSNCDPAIGSEPTAVAIDGWGILLHAAQP